MTRKIIHVDMDAFFASVEQRDSPELRGRPVAVGGRPETRGVVAAASYEARRFGVRSAMPAGRALALCPSLVFVPPRFSAYVEASQHLRRVFLEYTDLVEPMSLDEAFLDVTENRVGSDLATPIAREIRARIHRELSLTASAGVGPNKLIAKLASDERKPNGLTVIRPDQVERFLSPLPVDRLWGVGPATAKRLAALGLRTVADVRKYPRVLLEHKLGEYGGMLHLLAHGIDPRPVVPHRSARSRGAERTFARDIEARDELEAELRELAWEVGSAVKMERRPGKTVNLKVRYADFTTITRAHSPGSWVVDAETILDHGLRLLRGESNIGHRPVRLLGLSLSGLMEEEDDRQLRLPFELSPQWLQETRP